MKFKHNANETLLLTKQEILSAVDLWLQSKGRKFSMEGDRRIAASNNSCFTVLNVVDEIQIHVYNNSEHE